MTSHNLTDAFNKLPALVRADMFRTRTIYPAAFLSGIGKSRFPHYKDLKGEDMEYAWDDIKNGFFTLRDYADDFFPADEKNVIQIPDSVYEAFGVLAHDLDLSAPAPENISEDARAILTQVKFLRLDPYPRQTDYASHEARFVFLLVSYIQSFSHANYFAQTPAPRGYEAFLQLNFLNPMRTLDPKGSTLEEDILRNIRHIEFIRDFESHPHFSEPLAFIRSTAEDSLTEEEMLTRLGLPATNHMINAAILGLACLNESGLIAADRTLAFLLSPYAETKLLRSCIPDIEEEFLVFSMICPFIKSGIWEDCKSEWFGDDADKFETWHEWALSGISPAEPLPDAVMDKLSAVIAARDIADMESQFLLFRQNERPVRPVMYEQSLLETKITLMRIREDAIMKPVSNDDLGRLRGELLFSAFNELHNLSAQYPLLRLPANIGEGTIILEGPPDPAP